MPFQPNLIYFDHGQLYQKIYPTIYRKTLENSEKKSGKCKTPKSEKLNSQNYLKIILNQIVNLICKKYSTYKLNNDHNFLQNLGPKNYFPKDFNYLIM